MSEYTQEFESFWHVYPRRISKKAAFKSFERAIREGVDPAKIILAVEKYKKWLGGEGWRPECKHPTTYLNQGCWDDEYDIPEDKKAITFKLPMVHVEVLRGAGISDAMIKRWFDDADIVKPHPDGVPNAIVFKSEFMRDYVQNHFESQLRHAFGFMPALVLQSKAA